MLQTLKNAWKIPELKKKLLFTLLIVILFRLGANIPVPYVSSGALATFEQQLSGSIFQYMNFLSGNAFGKATLFALSVSPYITASIVVQLLTIAIPYLERKSKESDGKEFINALTRWITIGLSLLTAIGYAMYLNSSGMLTFSGGGYTGLEEFFMYAVMVACYCAGAAIIMWLAEQINQYGIGNGISMILLVNILSSVPTIISSIWGMIFTKGMFGGFSVSGLIIAICTSVGMLAMLVFVIWMTNSERRIPIQYAKRVVGRKMYGGQGTFLPIKLNMTGVMPIIFANSIIAIPATIAAFFPNQEWLNSVANFLNYDKWYYALINFALIIAFAYFYIMISFNPVEVANNIRSNGGAVPGIRPGKSTSDYIQKILTRITLIGAIMLGVVACLPMTVNCIDLMINPASTRFASIAFGGSSILIIVGVALETVQELEAQMTMRNYKGFLD